MDKEPLAEFLWEVLPSVRKYAVPGCCGNLQLKCLLTHLASLFFPIVFPAPTANTQPLGSITLSLN
jgi:hypothetical protein